MKNALLLLQGFYGQGKPENQGISKLLKNWRNFKNTFSKLNIHKNSQNQNF